MSRIIFYKFLSDLSVTVSVFAQLVCDGVGKPKIVVFIVAMTAAHLAFFNVVNRVVRAREEDASDLTHAAVALKDTLSCARPIRLALH
jgi:hypothetical protein